MKLLDKEILYLDNHLLIVDKPPLVPTQPTDRSQDSIQTRAEEYIREKFQKKGKAFLHPVHRLDRLASGIVVCARTSKALSRLNDQIRLGQWKKTYIVRHEGRLPEPQGTLIDHLERQEYRSIVSPQGKRAELSYKVIDAKRAYIYLKTGRYHQIRVQLAHIGCPICGDEKYGSHEKAISPGIDLHHTELSFPHPITKQMLNIHSPPPF